MINNEISHSLEANKWSVIELFRLRIAIVFFAGLILPIDPEFYHRITRIKWGHFKYHDLDIIANYFPWFANNAFDRDFSGILLLLLVSILFAWIWGVIDRKSCNYDNLRYFLTSIIRLKIAIAMFHFGWVKLFPLQMPYPSLSQLNTNLGDFTPGKLYWVHIAAVPAYEVFIGSAELLAALLVFFKRTSIAGLLILVAILLPVLVLNITYDAGVQLKSASLLIMGLYLLAPNLLKLYQFLVLNQSVNLVTYTQRAEKAWHSYGKVSVKLLLFLVFFGLYGVLAGQSYYKGESHMRRGIKSGLSKFQGFYDVEKYAVNTDTLPYSLTGTTRWNDVVFERWNTISIRFERPVYINLEARNTELFATVGRHYYAYETDTTLQVLYLKNRTDTTEKITLNYTELSPEKLALSGIDGKGDSLYVELGRIAREYPLKEGRVEKTYIP